LASLCDAAKRGDVGRISLGGSRLIGRISGFQAALKSPMILPNFEGQLVNPGVNVPLVLKWL
jgi:hypothetical protein